MEGNSQFYNRYNLHYVAEGGKNKGSYANWTEYAGHDFVPYNSRLTISIAGRRITFTTGTGKKIDWEFNPSRMGMSAREYVEMITSPNPVTYDNLSSVDVEGIQAGKVKIGMSKEGVLVALGYPAKHRTPSLDENRWVYWMGRHDSYAVHFDSDGKVDSIQD